MAVLSYYGEVVVMMYLVVAKKDFINFGDRDSTLPLLVAKRINTALRRDTDMLPRRFSGANHIYT